MAWPGCEQRGLGNAEEGKPGCGEEWNATRASESRSNHVRNVASKEEAGHSAYGASSHGDGGEGRRSEGMTGVEGAECGSKDNRGQQSTRDSWKGLGASVRTEFEDAHMAKLGCEAVDKLGAGNWGRSGGDNEEWRWLSVASKAAEAHGRKGTSELPRQLNMQNDGAQQCSGEVNGEAADDTKHNGIMADGEGQWVHFGEANEDEQEEKMFPVQVNGRMKIGKNWTRALGSVWNYKGKRYASQKWRWEAELKHRGRIADGN